MEPNDSYPTDLFEEDEMETGPEPDICSACNDGECEDCYGDCNCPHLPAG